MTANTSLPLPKPEWERFAQEIKSGKSRTESYMAAYGTTDRTLASKSAWRLMQNDQIKGRVVFLSPLAVKEEVDLKSVIHTCQEVIEDSESTPQKLKAIEVLNKLGVFDNESKTINRMDPAAMCEYLAQFASHPATELEHIPGGLSGLMKRLMDLTGASKGAMRDALEEATGVVFQAVGMVKDVDKDTDKFKEPEPLPLSDEDFPEDEDTQDEEILPEIIDAPPDPGPEPKPEPEENEEEWEERMKERLAPALAVASEVEAEDEKVEF